MSRNAIRAQQGLSIVEVLSAILLLGLTMTAAFGILTASKSSALITQRKAQAAGVAQKEVEKLRAVNYGQLSMKTTGTDLGSPHKFDQSDGNFPPRMFIAPGVGRWCYAPDSTSFFYAGAYECGKEQAVISGAGAVTSGPERFEVGGDGNPATTASESAAVRGDIYRYITWRDERCLTGVCDSRTDTKRITVAVKLDAFKTVGADPSANIVWRSTVVDDPSTLPAAVPPQLPGVGGSTRSEQIFNLYDTPCTSTVQSMPSGNHGTHSTAQTSSTLADWSRCTVGSATAPDLMGKQAPLYDNADHFPVLRNYSNEGVGTGIPGLRMRAQGGTTSSCATAPVSYDAANAAAASGSNKWNIHRWSTNGFATNPFVLDRYASIKLFSKAASVGSFRGVICATLLSRSEPAGSAPTEIKLASTEIDRNAWSRGDRAAVFSQRFTNMIETDGSGSPITNTGEPGPATIPANRRLVLALSVKGAAAGTGDDLLFYYGHPLYMSQLSIETSTPCTSGGTPC